MTRRIGWSCPSLERVAILAMFDIIRWQWTRWGPMVVWVTNEIFHACKFNYYKWNTKFLVFHVFKGCDSLAMFHSPIWHSSTPPCCFLSLPLVGTDSCPRRIHICTGASSPCQKLPWLHIWQTLLLPPALPKLSNQPVVKGIKYSKARLLIAVFAFRKLCI